MCVHGAAVERAVTDRATSRNAQDGVDPAPALYEWCWGSIEQASTIERRRVLSRRSAMNRASHGWRRGPPLPRDVVPLPGTKGFTECGNGAIPCSTEIMPSCEHDD